MPQPVLPESETDAAAVPALPAKPRRRAGFLLPLGLFLLVVVALLFALRPKPVPPPVVPLYTPQQAATAQQHIAALNAQLLHPSPVSDALPAPAETPVTPEAPPPAEVQKPRPAPSRPAAVRLQLSEADINTLLATNLQVVHALRAHGVNAIQILLHPPQGIDIRAAVLYKGHPANMEVVGTLQANPQTIVRFVASRAQIGQVPVPASVVTKQAASLAEHYTPRVRGRLPLQVQTVQIIRNTVVLTGIPPAKTVR